ncbi:hypothetical protein Tco_0865362 [Tanacetum coccineum]
MGFIDDIKSTLTQSALDALCEKIHIPHTFHPVLPGRNDRICNSPAGKTGVYTRFFDFANYRIPLSQFRVDVVDYFQINLSQLSYIAAAKISHFEILCHNDHFFWVDASVFFLAVPWHNNKTLRKDPHPIPAEFNADVCNYLAANLAPFRKFPEPFLCLVGINRYYELDDNCYLAFLIDDDEGEREVREGEAMLLELIRGLVVLLAGVNEKGNQNEAEQSDIVVQVGGIDVVADDEIQAIVADKPKGSMKKRKTAGGASGSNLPPKRLSEDHGAPSASASTGGKFVFVLQDLLDRKREGGGPADSVYGPNLWTQNPIERFVISSDYSHYSSTNAVGAEVDSIVRSSAPPSNVMTTAVATTAVAGTSSAPALEPARTSIFADSCEDRKDVEQIYIPKWNVINDSSLDDPDICRSMVDQLDPLGFFSQLGGLVYEHLEMKKFENKCTRLTGLLNEKDVEVANLKAQLSLKEAEAAEALCLRGQVATVEAAKAARVAELNSLKEQVMALKGQVAALKSATTVKDTELSFLTANTAHLTHDLSTSQTSFDELTIKAASLESEKDGLIGQNNHTGFISIRRIQQGRYGVSAPALHKRPRKFNDLYVVSRRSRTPYSWINSRKIPEDIKRGPFSKKSPICRNDYTKTAYRLNFKRL